jgi:hypothetical protein
MRDRIGVGREALNTPTGCGTDLDPAAIMAEHRRYWFTTPEVWCTAAVCGEWPCLPYRLAAALVKAEAERDAFKGACGDLASARTAEVAALRKVIAILSPPELAS